jgi:branched-chain amino acid transport system permease protein
MDYKRYFQPFILIIVLISIQLFTYLTDTGYYLTQLTMAAYYSLVIIGLCVLMGYAGQISLGHAGFFAIGGYISALLTTYNLLPYKDHIIISFFLKTGLLVLRENLYGISILNVHPWLACIVAILFTVLIAYIIGGPVLKLKGHYLAMATLGFGIIVFRIVLGAALFGEADGLSDVPAFTLFPGVEVSGNLTMRIQNYYIAYGLVIIGLIILINLINSRVGRALRSIHGAEDASNAMGVDTAKYKLHTFVLSAAFAAVAGVFLTHYNGGIGPSEASVMKSIRYVAIVAVGGMANLWGALTMGIVLNYLSLRGYFGSFDDAVFGVILIVIMLFTPEGLLRYQLLSEIKKVFSNKKPQAIHNEHS